jgi:hypothetical protein
VGAFLSRKNVWLMMNRTRFLNINNTWYTLELKLAKNRLFVMFDLVGTYRVSNAYNLMVRFRVSDSGIILSCRVHGNFSF